MGATVFYTTARGKTAQEAFDRARDNAEDEHGTSGYTGTIAEKESFKLVELSDEVMNNRALFMLKIDELVQTKFNNKWGPAGAVKLKEGEYYFFGWASE